MKLVILQSTIFYCLLKIKEHYHYDGHCEVAAFYNEVVETKSLNVTIYIVACVLWCPMSTHKVKSVERSCVSILHELHHPL